MGKLYCIIGRSGSGKSSICDKVVEDIGIKKVITDATRPIREGEVDGVDYNFIDINEYGRKLVKNRYVAAKSFREWGYGVDVDSIDLTQSDYIIVIDPKGYYELLELYGEKVVRGVLLEVDSKDLLRRSINRDSDMKEVARRFLADEEDFAYIQSDEEVLRLENSNGCEWITVGILSALIQYDFNLSQIYDTEIKEMVEND